MPTYEISFSGRVAHTIEAESGEEALKLAYQRDNEAALKRYVSFLDVARAMKAYKHAVVTEVSPIEAIAV